LPIIGAASPQPGSVLSRKRARLAREQVRADNTLRKIAEEAFEARNAELKGDGTAGRRFSPLELHVLPRLGKIPVEEIDQRYIRDALAPIWHDKADTARKAMNRLGICLRHAAALGLDVDLQATEKAKALLGKSRHKPTNIAAMHWAEMPAFVASIEEPAVTHMALRVLILTGVRSGPLRHLRLDQIEGDIRTIPGEGMKGRRDRAADFRVPLTQCIFVSIDEAQQFATQGLWTYNNDCPNTHFMV